MLIDELAKRYRWVNDDTTGKIKVVPMNQFEWRSYPINEDDTPLLVTEDEFIGLATRLYMFNGQLTAVVPFDMVAFKQFIGTRPTPQRPTRPTT